jgi:uncharacterized membrane protein YqgA involved in biofilm formation
VIGTLLNVAGIVIGGLVGTTRRRLLSPATESFFKVTIGVLTVFYGLRLTWISLSGSVWQILKQVLIAVLALMLGKLTGRLLRLQQLSNRLGCGARGRITEARRDDPRRLSEGFKTGAVLFCAAPMGILGAVQDGLSSYPFPLGIKGLMDGLATLGLVSLFGWGVTLSALPVLALEGTITLLCAEFLSPYLQAHGAGSLVNSVNATGGLIVFSVALVILGLKRIELADYLPSLAFAPVITWMWK